MYKSDKSRNLSKIITWYSNIALSKFGIKKKFKTCDVLMNMIFGHQGNLFKYICIFFMYKSDKSREFEKFFYHGTAI